MYNILCIKYQKRKVLHVYINYTSRCCLNTFHEKHLKDTVCDKQLIILNGSIYS